MGVKWACGWWRQWVQNTSCTMYTFTNHVFFSSINGYRCLGSRVRKSNQIHTDLLQASQLAMATACILINLDCILDICIHKQVLSNIIIIIQQHYSQEATQHSLCFKMKTQPIAQLIICMIREIVSLLLASKQEKTEILGHKTS